LSEWVRCLVIYFLIVVDAKLNDEEEKIERLKNEKLTGY
jgi:hypothetical protein